MNRPLLALGLGLLALPLQPAHGEISATHVYHNHMPNFWAYYDTSQLEALPTGTPITYTWDAYVIELKNNPPPEYTYYLSNGQPMPHDDLASYYSHHAKQGAYMSWPMDTANENRGSHPQSQTQVTMSASVVSNVQSLNTLQNVDGYNNPSWGDYWKNTYSSLTTSGGHRALDLIHFTGHHTLGPLIGDAYFEKELIYHGAMLAQPFFLGDSYRSSKGFFPTELGFSERLIPTLKKMGVEWSVLGNVHFSRTLQDYPYLDQPGIDTITSPPNRADLQNTSTVGDWVSIPMFNEAQVTHNKFPFASIPHWVRFVDPNTGETSQLAGIPVEQASSWEEGYLCSIKADPLKAFEGDAAALGRTQYFVIAHDGDNSSGCAGDGGTWANSGRVTYSDSGVTGKGISEYLEDHPIPANDIQHVQDGSWIDTRDSSADPTWYHWHLPFGIWQGQFSDFNREMGFDYAPKTNLDGVLEGMTVSLEYGYHYLERNYALLQAALNYTQTAEQIWLDEHPNHWQPQSILDRQITYPGNQLNPWMMSFPSKGDPNQDWAGGANPAELAWYFLMPAIDSGFGYYDENEDDNVKPTLAFNQSLDASEDFVNQRLTSDQTGPSVWWPQRWPYNPGSANVSKAEGWTLHHFDSTFAIYTYAFDVNDVTDIKVKVRMHRDKTISPTDKTCRVYDPESLSSDPQVDPDKVGEWVTLPMVKRDLTPDINGVPWQAGTLDTMETLPARKIADLYYTYIEGYSDVILDYYVEAEDGRGNVTRSNIQQVYVGHGRYSQGASGYVEDATGAIEGTHAFVTDSIPQVSISLYLEANGADSLELQTKGDDGIWSLDQLLTSANALGDFYRGSLAYPADQAGIDLRYRQDGGQWIPSLNGVFLAEGTHTIYDNGDVIEGPPEGLTLSATIYYQNNWQVSYMHWRPAGEEWTVVPGEAMEDSEFPGYRVLTVDLGAANSLEAAFNDGGSTWDSNGGQNYIFPPGTSSLSLGIITEGEPDPTAPMESSYITLYYTNGFDTPWIHYRQGSGVWTSPPGEEMVSSQLAGYHLSIVDVGTLGLLEAAFNDGNGTWDNNGGLNYRFSSPLSVLDAGEIGTVLPLPTGTCCADDTCFETTQEACGLVGGLWNPATPTPTATQGPSPTPTPTFTPVVSPTPDPSGLGACCLEASCSELNAMDCIEASGDWLGSDVSCDDAPCSGTGCSSLHSSKGNTNLAWVLLGLLGLPFLGLRVKQTPLT